MADYLSDAVILTAVETETAAIRQCFGNYKRLIVSGDRQEYYELELMREGRNLRIITSQQHIMGMTATTLLAAKAVERFRPRYLIMCGIAAGITEQKDQLFGDVIVPDVVWDYSTGKYVGADEAEIRFGEKNMLGVTHFYFNVNDELKKLIEQTAKMPDNECHIHIGPMACGSSVVANSNYMEKQIRALNPHTIGLDMESYAVFFVANNIGEPKPNALVAKCIFDFANEQKDDRFQKFAAFTSVQYVRNLLEKYLPFD